MAKVVIIDDEAPILDLMTKFCRSMGHEVHARQTAHEGLETLALIRPELLLVDLHIGDDNGLEIIKQCRKTSPQTAIIMVTGHSSIETAVEAMRLGAFDYLAKPFELDELSQTIHQALDQQQSESSKPVAVVSEQAHTLPGQVGASSPAPQLIGQSDALKKIIHLIKRVADSDSPVLLEGEFGVGKQLIAKVLHQSGRRKGSPFRVIQCSALSPELLEAELFGHQQAQGGIFERARGGTVHLAEIHLMPMALQAKLHALMDQSAGALANCRLIASTSQHLESLIEDGKFREDLYYKISVIPVQIPSLRERQEDIPLLVDHFLRELSQSGKPIQIQPYALEYLKNYSWPGNISELRNAVERACALCENDTITPADLPPKITQKISRDPLTENDDDGSSQAAIGPLPVGSTLDSFIKAQEKLFINETLKYNNGSREKTASMLGISIATLYRKMELNVTRKTTT